MQLSIARNIAIISITLFLLACDSHDSDYIPYGLKGMNSYVYNNDTEKEFYAGNVKGSYFSKDKTLSNCQSLAYSFAKQQYIENWSYICCTVTPSSSCATKVK